MTSFDDLTTNGRLSAIYGQLLFLVTKTNDMLARLAHLETHNHHLAEALHTRLEEYHANSAQLRTEDTSPTPPAPDAQPSDTQPASGDGSEAVVRADQEPGTVG